MPPATGCLKADGACRHLPMLYAAVSSGTLLGIQEVPLSLEGQGIVHRHPPMSRSKGSTLYLKLAHRLV